MRESETMGPPVRRSCSDRYDPDRGPDRRRTGTWPPFPCGLRSGSTCCRCGGNGALPSDGESAPEPTDGIRNADHRNPLESPAAPAREASWEIIDAVYCCRVQSSSEAGGGRYRPLQTLVLRWPGSAVERAADPRRGLELRILSPEFEVCRRVDRRHSAGQGVPYTVPGVLQSDQGIRQDLTPAPPLSALLADAQAPAPIPR